MTRRRLLQTVLGIGALGAAARFVGAGGNGMTEPTNTFEVAPTGLRYCMSGVALTFRGA
jgi:hypothetical protein